VGGVSTAKFYEKLVHPKRYKAKKEKALQDQEEALDRLGTALNEAFTERPPHAEGLVDQRVVSPPGFPEALSNRRAGRKSQASQPFE
jgi:hypothetical protein